jgi:hypothetical protein
MVLLLLSWDSDSPPFGGVAASDALDFHAFEPLEQVAAHFHAHTGAGLPEIGDGEQARLGVDGSFNQRGLRAAQFAVARGDADDPGRR